MLNSPKLNWFNSSQANMLSEFFLQFESWYFGIWWGKTPLSSFTCRKKLKTNIKYQVSTLLLSVRRSYACGKMLLEIYERLLSELNWRWLGNGWNWMGMEKCTSSLATDFSGRPCARLVSIWSDHLAFLHHLACNRLAYELACWWHPRPDISFRPNANAVPIWVMSAEVTGKVRGFSALRTRKAPRYVFIVTK